jgi:transposase
MLNPVQIQCAEMIAKGDSKTYIAQELNVERSTIYKWMRSPKIGDEFMAKVDEWQQEYLSLAQANIKRLAPKAAKVLEAMLDSDSDKIKLEAVKEVLDRDFGKPKQNLDINATPRQPDVIDFEAELNEIVIDEVDNIDIEE